MDTTKTAELISLNDVTVAHPRLHLHGHREDHPMAKLQSISDLQLVEPSPLCPRCNTSTLVWYTDAPQTKGKRVQIGGPAEIGYRCTECFLFVAIPYSTGPVYRQP